MALHLLPRGTGRRRAVDKVARLRAELAAAEARADRLNRENNTTACELIKLAAEIDEQKTARQAAEEHVDSLTGELAETADDRDRLRRRLNPYLAADANRDAVSVPPWTRDTNDDDGDHYQQPGAWRAGITTLQERGAA